MPRTPTPEELRRQQVNSLNGRAIAAADAGDYQEALRFLKAAFDPEPENETLKRNIALVQNGFGKQAHARGDYGTAITLFGAARAAFPNDLDFAMNHERSKYHPELKIKKERDASNLADAEGRVSKMLDDFAEQFAARKPTADEGLGFMGGDQLGLGFMDAGPAPPRPLSALPDARERSKPMETAFPPVPSPKGYRSADERRRMAASLSDISLASTISHTQTLLNRLRDDLGGEETVLGEVAREAEKAEEDALLAALNLLLAGALDDDVFPAKSPEARDLKFLLERSQTTADQLASLDKPPLEKVRAVMLDGIKLVRSNSEYLTRRITEKGMQAIGRTAALASFTADYGLAASRWAMAWNRTRAIVDNLDKPNGKLAAERALSRLYKDMIDERKRRQAE